MKIFVDFPLSEKALARLQEGTAGHELLFPGKLAKSILHAGGTDPAFGAADVAFGQPDPAAIAESGMLRWIHLSSSGYTRYDHAAFREMVTARKIPVSNSAGVYAEGCATHLLAFLLAQARQLPQALDSSAANGTPEWVSLRGACADLRGETVLILGYGSIGRRLAELLRPFAMKVLAYRRKARGNEGVPVVEDLAAALKEADHVVNILPDSEATRGFFDAARLADIRPGAVFYNIGRGTTVDQDALLAALRSGGLGAAWLDVTDPEPLPAEHPLRGAPNCHITPHIAGGHPEETVSLVRHFLENLRRFERGEALVDRIM